MYLSSKQAWLLSILLMAQKTLEEPCKCSLNLIVTSSQTVPEKLQQFVLNLTVHKLSMAELDLQFFFQPNQNATTQNNGRLLKSVWMISHHMGNEKTI